MCHLNLFLKIPAKNPYHNRLPSDNVTTAGKVFGISALYQKNTANTIFYYSLPGLAINDRFAADCRNIWATLRKLQAKCVAT